ncbi:DUF4258 domain-containing protein [Peptococcaceae bacterium]|nr:DUF4258 domain-containing protein [Peptococcaceae bacterium]
MFVCETEEGYYEKIPFSMSDLGAYAYAEGQKVPLKTQGNSILVPTEEGPVAVPIEEFCVVMIDGQVALITEENPAWKAFLIFRAGKKLWKVTKGATVTKHIPRYIKVNGVNLEVTRHAAKRMVQRNISEETIRAIIKKSKKRYYDPHPDHKSFIAWCDRRKIAIAFPKKTTERAKK